jgi:hypothetical protein
MMHTNIPKMEFSTTPNTVVVSHLARMAWRALIQASPTANPDSLAVKAIDLAKAFYKVEEALFQEVRNGHTKAEEETP